MTPRPRSLLGLLRSPRPALPGRHARSRRLSLRPAPFQSRNQTRLSFRRHPAFALLPATFYRFSRRRSRGRRGSGNCPNPAQRRQRTLDRDLLLFEHLNHFTETRASSANPCRRRCRNPNRSSGFSRLLPARILSRMRSANVRRQPGATRGDLRAKWTLQILLSHIQM